MLATTEKPTISITEPVTKAEYYALLTPTELTLSKELGKNFYDGSRKSIEGIKEAGEALLEAKSKLKGKFNYFCKYELPLNISKDTIENFMRAAVAIKANPQLAKYNPTIIFELSKRSTPPEIVEEMSALAESNQHQEIKVKDVKKKIAEAKENTIKKGDIVEWSDVTLKNYKYGRVAKVSDGIVKLQSLSGSPLGERPVKFVSRCPIQKQNSNPSHDLIEGDLITVQPYCSWLQEYKGKTGKVIGIQPKKLLASILLDGSVLEFHWEEIEKVEQQVQPNNQQVQPNQIVDVTVTETQVISNSPATSYINGFPVSNNKPNNQIQALVDELYARIGELDNQQSMLLLGGLKANANLAIKVDIAVHYFKADFEANVRGLLCSVNGNQFDYLLEMVLEHKDDLEKLNARYKWDE